MKSVTRICPGCGRPFTMAQSDYDKRLNLAIDMPLFCSSKCAFHGWDTKAVWYGAYRRAMDNRKS